MTQDMTAFGDITIICDMLVEEQGELLVTAYHKAVAEGVPQEVAASEILAKAVLQYAKDHRIKRVAKLSVDRIIRYLWTVQGFKSVTVLR